MSKFQFSPEANQFLKQARSSWKLNFYFLKNLPSAWWWGLRLEHADNDKCKVSLPFNWRTQNPFRSIYFAALAGAGEFSTGIIASAARMGRGNISMLVIDQKMEFVKKANSKITFTCEDAQKVIEVVEKAAKSSEAQTCHMTAVGRNEAGEKVATFEIVWSFKKRKEK